MLGIALPTIAVAGLLGAIPVLLLSGIVGGAVTGWYTSSRSTLIGQLQLGGFHGLHASGAGGIVLFLLFLFLDAATIATDEDVLVFLVASPMAVVVYAVTGLFGGYLGSGLRYVHARMG